MPFGAFPCLCVLILHKRQSLSDVPRPLGYRMLVETMGGAPVLSTLPLHLLLLNLRYSSLESLFPHFLRLRLLNRQLRACPRGYQPCDVRSAVGLGLGHVSSRFTSPAALGCAGVLVRVLVPTESGGCDSDGRRRPYEG